MSKRDLKKKMYELNKEQLEAQIIELYEKFSPVKVIMILFLSKGRIPKGMQTQNLMNISIQENGRRSRPKMSVLWLKNTSNISSVWE
jgi:hypothetical protein